MHPRIGIYSGTFDPVHAGHVAFALAALTACGLDKVVFLPEKQPRGKRGVTDISHRTTLLHAALAGIPALDVIELPYPTFTIKQVLPEFQKTFKDAELTLLVGSDVARSIMSWPDIALLLAATHLAVGMRAKDSEEELANYLAPNARITFVHTNFPTLTSSKVRDGKAGHITEAVAEYAREHALYTARERSYAS